MPESTRRRGGPAWSQFLCTQAETILACDSFTAELLDGTQAYVLAVIHTAAPLKPLPEPINLGHYRVRKLARVGGPVNEYRLVA